jgi:DNA-binding Lrp family transcriptional regulator
MAIFMATAYVLIKAQPGYERDVYYSLARRRRFTELHPVTGQYNLVAKVTSDSTESIGYIILEEINNTENVSSYETLNATTF